MDVRPADAMHLVPACVVAVVSRGVTARKAEERHGGHARGSENNTEDVEIHLYGEALRPNRNRFLRPNRRCQTSPDESFRHGDVVTVALAKQSAAVLKADLMAQLL
jgi:hypothetical protein